MPKSAKSLKDYLIGIGWKVDETGLRKADDSTRRTLKQWRNLSVNFNKSLKELSTSQSFSLISSFFIGITKSAAKLLNDVAAVDLEIEHLAKQWMTSADNARAFNEAVEGTGLSMGELAFATKEEVQHFEEIYNYSKSLEPPAALKETLRDVRQIGLQIQKLRTFVSYLGRAISYYIGQRSGDEIKYWGGVLRNFTEWLAKSLPSIAKFIGRFVGVVLNFMSGIAKLAKSLWDLFGGVKSALGNLVNFLPILAVALSTFLLTPVGRVIAAFTTLALLVEDFMYWKAGKKSVFGELFGDYKDFSISNALGNFGEAIANVLDPLGVLREQIDQLKKAWNEGWEAGGLFGAIKSALKQLFGLGGPAKYSEDFDISSGFFEDYRSDQNISIYGNLEETLRALRGLEANERAQNTLSNNYSSSNVALDSHDTYYVGSPEEAARISKNKTIDNIKASYNSGLTSPIMT